MPTPLVVVVLVTAIEAHSPATETMVNTTQDALGPAAIVVVRGLEALPDDPDALRIAEALHAGAVVELRWTDALHTRAHLHVYRERGEGAGWTERDLAFSAADVPEERGRTVGLAVASMMPGFVGRATEPPPPPTPLRAKAPERAIVHPASVPPVERKIWRFEMGAGANAGLGIDQRIQDLGGFGEVRADYGALGARLAAGIRFGDLAATGIRSNLVRLDLGLVWTASMSRAISLGARADSSLIRQMVARGASSDARWLPGGEVLLEGAWGFAPPVALAGAVGAEVAFGTTGIRSSTARLADFPDAHIVGELGIRARF